jgi:hypothetical protein
MGSPPFTVDYAPLAEIENDSANYFFDTRFLFVRDVSHPSHYLLIEKINAPLADAEHFNVVRAISGVISRCCAGLPTLNRAYATQTCA